MRDFVPDDFLPEPDAVHGVRDDAETGEPIPDELVDAFFDGELEDDESRDFIRELRNDAPTAKKVVSLNSALEALRRPVSTPDFTGSVMDEVEGRTPWLSGREFALLGHWRAVAAVCVLCLITAAFVTQRVAPGTTFVTQDAPVTRLTETIPGAANGIGYSFDASFNAAQQLVLEPARESTAPCRGNPWCFAEFSREFIATGCVEKANACASSAAKASDTPSCVDECGAVQMRTRQHDSNSIIGAPRMINASFGSSGTVIVK